MPSPRPRFTIRTVTLLIVTAALASALFAEVYRLTNGGATSSYDPEDIAVFVAAVALNALTLASLKGHTGGQAMLQMDLAYLACLSLVQVAQLVADWLLIGWYPVALAGLVLAPLMVRRQARRLERGPRRTWWLTTTEAVAFAFLNLHLALVEVGMAQVVADLGKRFSR